MKQILINLYEIHELTPQAKEIALSEHFEFLCQLGQEVENEDGTSYIDYSEPEDAEVLESIEANDYMFYADGKIAHCCTYIAGPKAGKTELIIGTDYYLI